MNTGTVSLNLIKGSGERHNSMAAVESLGHFVPEKKRIRYQAREEVNII